MPNRKLSVDTGGGAREVRGKRECSFFYEFFELKNSGGLCRCGRGKKILSLCVYFWIFRAQENHAQSTHVTRTSHAQIIIYRVSSKILYLQHFLKYMLLTSGGGGGTLYQRKPSLRQ